MVSVIRDMVSNIWERALSVFSPGETELDVSFTSKSLMKFDRNKLFKGHSGTICTFQGDICIYNQYYEASSHQRVEGKTVHIRLQQEFRNPKWLDKKLEKLSTLLKTLQYENMPNNNDEFVMYHQDFEYHIRPYHSYVCKKYNGKIDDMLNHWDSIQVFKKMKRLYPILREKFKQIEISELAEMASELHHNANNTWIIHPNILNSSPKNGTT